MIFVTTGSLFPFERLIAAMDEVAGRMTGEAFFAQIGATEHLPRNMPYARLISRPEFIEKAKSAKMIVAHAGMGSVLSALEFQRPIIIMPRRLELGEHNTDHQMATARWLSTRPGIRVCFEAAELEPAITQILAGAQVGNDALAEPPAEFIARLRAYLA